MILCCMFFFDIRILITTLASSNSSSAISWRKWEQDDALYFALNQQTTSTKHWTNSESWIICHRLHMTLSICLLLTQNYKPFEIMLVILIESINVSWHIQCGTFTRTENNKDVLCICSGGQPYEINTGVNIFIINQII